MDTNKMLNFSKWTPNKSDLEWTENFLNDQTDGFIWITSHYSLKINKKTKTATMTDVNFKVMKENPTGTIRGCIKNFKGINRYRLEIYNSRK